MSEKRFQVTVLEQFCKGCALCVEFCPVQKLRIRRLPNKKGIQTAYSDPDIECTGCMACVIICPDAALELVRTAEPAASPAGGSRADSKRKSSTGTEPDR